MELRVWALMAVPTGVLSGGVAGVLVNATFGGRAADWLLGLAVALITGAGPLANVFSVVWSHWSQGRDKIASLRLLLGAFSVCLIVMAWVPFNAPGLMLLLLMTLCAQVLWCGMITIRAAVWRANYSRQARTVFAARYQIIVSVIISSAGAGAGYLLDLTSESLRVTFLVGAACALLGLLALRRVRVRRHRQLLEAERALSGGRRFRPDAFLSILRNDQLYRAYLGCLMLTAPLILVLTHHLGVPASTQVLISASLPILLMPITTPYWAKVLSDRHVITFRAVNSGVFVAATAAALAGGILGSIGLLWVSAALRGIGFGGSALGWNIGHNDFAPEARAVEYLGLHVTLTGIRGFFSPLIGVGVYETLERWQPGAGAWALALPCLLTATGTLGFVWLNGRLQKRSIAESP
jgi:MFS family permease